MVICRGHLLGIHLNISVETNASFDVCVIIAIVYEGVKVAWW